MVMGPGGHWGIPLAFFSLFTFPLCPLSTVPSLWKTKVLVIVDGLYTLKSYPIEPK